MTSSMPSHPTIRVQVLHHALAAYIREIASPASLATDHGELKALILLDSMRSDLFIMVGSRWSLEEEETLRRGFGLDDLAGHDPALLHAQADFPYDLSLIYTGLFAGMSSRILTILRCCVGGCDWETLVLRYSVIVSECLTMRALERVDTLLYPDCEQACEDAVRWLGRMDSEIYVPAMWAPSVLRGPAY
ncbi:hypothetical protein FB107DRAFT_268966 [Schizophyllum commune]